jgi:hypothetical protein
MQAMMTQLFSRLSPLTLLQLRVSARNKNGGMELTPQKKLYLKNLKFLYSKNT